MPYIFQTRYKDYITSLDIKALSFPKKFVDEKNIENIGIYDEFYFHVVDKNIVTGPYIITSKIFPLKNPMNDYWTAPDNYIEGIKDISFRFFFDSDGKDIQEYPVKRELPFFINEKEVKNEIQNINLKPLNEAVLIVDEEKFLFTFTLLIDKSIYRFSKKFSNSWMNEIIKLKEKIVKYIAKEENDKAIENVKTCSDLIKSFFIKGNEEFWNKVPETLYIFAGNRGNFIPFSWINLSKDKYFANTKKILYKKSNITEFKNKKEIENALIISDPTNTISTANDEARRIYNFLNENNVRADIISKDLSYLEIKNYFEKYDLIHFIGHGENGWRLSKRRVLSADKIPLLKNAPYLVVSNSCRTALFLGQYDFITKLLENKVSWVLASDLKIPDKNMFNFFHSFYKDIIINNEVADAFRKSVNKCIKEKKLDWIYFKLFGNGKIQ